MKKKLKIGIAGCGAIGSSLANVIVKDLSGRAILAGLYDIDILKARKLSERVSVKKSLAVDSLQALIRKAGLVIECASAQASRGIAKSSVRAGRDVMVMSVGGLISHLKELTLLAKKYNARVYIPSGAVCGLDALKAAAGAKISEAVLTTRKNPLSFKGVKYVEEKNIALDKIKKDTLLFSGTAEEAVKYFPQNINVAAVLSLAGIGSRRTKVRIIASPSLKRNVHEIKIISAAGEVFTRTENVLHPDNPKTSYLAVLSAAAALKQILEPVKIGT